MPLAEKPLSAVLARSAGRGRRGGGGPSGGPREGAGGLIGLGLWWMPEGPPGLPLRRGGGSCCGSFTSGSAWRNSIALVLGHSGLNPSAGGGGSANCSKRPDPERPDLCSHEQQVRKITTRKVRKLLLAIHNNWFWAILYMWSDTALWTSSACVGSGANCSEGPGNPQRARLPHPQGTELTQNKTVKIMKLCVVSDTKDEENSGSQCFV